MKRFHTARKAPDRASTGLIEGMGVRLPSGGRRGRRSFFFWLNLSVAALFVCGDPPEGRAAESEIADESVEHWRLADLTIEELMDIEVAIASRRSEPLRHSAAAVHVITGEQIRRSGATSIPEALRMAPGVHVGQVDSHQWAISTRGFSDQFANKQLVMIDGRSIYTPLFSGVFWDAHDTFMEDIDRIEVVRGPGASLWGANAVNGVINVITKDARHTQDTLMYAGVGTYEQGFTGVRHGGELGDSGYFRVYAKHFQRDNLQTSDGEEGNDAWHVNRGGFRADMEPDTPARFTFQGDIYGGELSNRIARVEGAPPGPFTMVPQDTITDIAGGHVLGRMTYSGLRDSEVEVQTYYDRNIRDSDIFREDRRTVDAEFQHTFRAGERHRFMWGGGYRLTTDRIDNTLDIALDPDRRTDHLFNAFVQDEIELVGDRLTWTLGSKFEHNDYTGFEFQPSTRLLWLLRERQALWGAVSRAVRSPSRAEHDIRLNQADEDTGALVSIFGREEFRSEDMIAYELGYRVQPADQFTLDFALFYKDYDNLRSLENMGFQPDPTDPHVRIEVDNKMSGETYGGEAAATWQASEWWRWRGGYSLLRMHLRTDRDSEDTMTVDDTEGRSPRHQIFIRSAVDLPGGWTFDTGARYVDNLPAPEVRVGSYTQMDARIAWVPEDSNIEFSLVGRNLLRRRHAEATPSFIATQGNEVERGVYGKLSWQF